MSKITEDSLKGGLLRLIDLNEDKQFQAPLEHKNKKTKDKWKIGLSFFSRSITNHFCNKVIQHL